MSFDEIFDLTAGVYFHFLFERSEFLIPTCGTPVIPLYSKKKARVFVRFNLNLEWVTRKMSAVVADHTKKKKKTTCGSPVIALYSKKKGRVFVRFNINLD